jgi:hypothetical protein
MSIKSLLVAIGMSVASLTAAHATPVQLITNGGFETGDFTGWTAVSNGVSGGCGQNVWEVNSTGHQGCQGNGTTVAAPISGVFGAFNSFDGGAAPYTLTQQITVPGSVLSATLSFLDEFHMGYSGALRTFSVDFYDATGSQFLGNVFSQNPGFSENQSWTSHNFDVTSLLASQAGQQINLRFTEIIPQGFTGPGGFGLDNVSLTAAVPEPATTALFGIALLGFAASRRKKAKSEKV